MQLASVSDESLDDFLRWWLDRLLPRKRKQADYPTRVALRRGLNALTDTPQIIVGTGHSVKGGEADIVFMFPDLLHDDGHEPGGRCPPVIRGCGRFRMAKNNRSKSACTFDSA